MVLFLGILHLSLPNLLTFTASINVVVEIYLTLSPQQKYARMCCLYKPIHFGSIAYAILLKSSWKKSSSTGR
jgi:TctA family transporter